MKYVFAQFTAESRFLSRNDCIAAQLGYEEYLSDNGYNYIRNMFVHDAYYKWRYLTIDDLSDKYTKLPYAIGDEIYFVIGRDLDKFKETVLKGDSNNFKFVEKSEFYDWALYNEDSRLKKITDNYLKNTKCSYTQFKNLNVGDKFYFKDGDRVWIKVEESPYASHNNALSENEGFNVHVSPDEKVKMSLQFKDLNVGDIFKIPNRDFLYIKVFPVDTGHSKWNAVVLTGDRKGYTINFTPENNVERCIGDSSLKELASKYLKDDKDSFMTYGGVDYNKIANDRFNYNSADVKNTLKFLELCQDYRQISFPCVKKVIFNKPATIVIWADGTKTVVKCQKDKNGKYEKYDKEKGLALCYMKKALGNESNYYNVIKNIIDKFG